MTWNSAAQANDHGGTTMSMSRLRQILATCALILTVLAVALVASHRDKLTRVYHVVRLFEPEQIAPNFRSMESLFHTALVRRSETAHQFESEPRALPPTYEYRGTTRDVEHFLQDTWTTGLIVLQDGKIVHEKYFRGNTAASKSISWSVAKSFISALVGIAVAEGRIADVHRSVSDYVPALVGSGYDGVPVKDVLQMSSGIRFNENYGEFCSDINRLGRAIAFDTSLDEFVASLKRERAPGTFHHYVSVDTQVLGMLLRQMRISDDRDRSVRDRDRRFRDRDRPVRDRDRRGFRGGYGLRMNQPRGLGFGHFCRSDDAPASDGHTHDQGRIEVEAARRAVA